MFQDLKNKNWKFVGAFYKSSEFYIDLQHCSLCFLNSHTLPLFYLSVLKLTGYLLITVLPERAEAYRISLHHLSTWACWSWPDISSPPFYLSVLKITGYLFTTFLPERAEADRISLHSVAWPPIPRLQIQLHSTKTVYLASNLSPGKL